MTLKNVQIIDGADNATYSIFQVTKEEFLEIFPRLGQDLEVVEDYIARVGESAANTLLSKMWERPISKQKARGIHGTLFYDYSNKAKHLPNSRREVDRPSGQLNESQRILYEKLRAKEERE
jgi:hypothetical protein